MILTTKSEKQHYFDKLITDPNHYLFYIGADGNLMTNSHSASSTFLAYQNGHWYGRKDRRVGTSGKLPEKGKFLFAISSSKVWMRWHRRVCFRCTYPVRRCPFFLIGVYGCWALFNRY